MFCLSCYDGGLTEGFWPNLSSCAKCQNIYVTCKDYFFFPLLI